MKRVKDIVKEFYPLRYIMDRLALCTPMGRDMLFDSYMITNKDELEREFNKLEKAIPLLGSKYVKDFRAILSSFRDIRMIAKSLSKGFTLSEVELFELKYLSYNIAMLTKLSAHGGFDIINLDKIFTILDPCNSKVVNFYIYDVYDKELSELKKELKNSSENRDEIYLKIACREKFVREQLSNELHKYSELISNAIDRVAEIDLIIAKIELIKAYNLVRPIISGEYESIRYDKLFNPYLRDIIRSKGGDYQSIDIDLIAAPTLITGANMSGKTMLLKSVALAQYMVQFGFFAPAEYSKISLVDDIFISIGDGQREEEGLSSFASEMINVSNIIETISDGGRYLVLLDELARTTSPKEGAAIVDAVVSVFSKKGVMSLITTHYSSLESNCRCKRVKGFVENKIDVKLTKENISQFIDYSLVDDTTADQRESEAVKIAEIMGVNITLIEQIKMFLKR